MCLGRTDIHAFCRIHNADRSVIEMRYYGTIQIHWTRIDRRYQRLLGIILPNRILLQCLVEKVDGKSGQLWNAC